MNAGDAWGDEEGHIFQMPGVGLKEFAKLRDISVGRDKSSF